MKTLDVVNRIGQIKRLSPPADFMTNIYRSFAAEDPAREWDVADGGNTLFITLHERGADRLLFCSNDADDFIRTSKSFRGGYTLDIVSKDRKQHSGLLRETGFEKIAEMKRVSNRDVSGFVSEMTGRHPGRDISAEAGMPDMDDVYGLLWAEFDTRVSHLPGREELAGLMGRGEFRIIRDGAGKIVSLLQARKEPKKYYFNQIINRGDKEAFHACVCRSLGRYLESGGRYAYAWVDGKNAASMKFFGKYGLSPDGLYTSVYAR